MGNFLSRQTSAEAQSIHATDFQVEGVPAVSREAAQQAERIDEKLAAAGEGATGAAADENSHDGMPTDLADIMAQGLHEEEDVESLPSLQSALQDLKAKHGINMGDSQQGNSGSMGELTEQEARLRALLKNKKRPAPKAAEEISSSSESDSDSDSSDSSSSSEEDASKQPPAKRTKVQDDQVDMDEGSDEEDDEATESRAFGAGAGLKTDHEEPEPPVEPPPIAAFPPEAGELNILGHVHNKVGNVAVIQSAFHSEHHVLDSGTLVGLPDRTVIGSVFETFGPLAKPFFSVRFPSEQTPSLTALEVRQPVVFCPANPNYATLLKTLDVRALSKGSDASNFFDEEPAAHEMEFSDDEAEQAYKRSLKKSRQDHHRESAPYQQPQHPRYASSSKDAMQTDSQDLPYDEAQPPSTPASASSDSRPSHSATQTHPRGQDQRERGRGRGRGRDRVAPQGRGRGREPRGGRGRDRGGRGGRGRDPRDRDPRDFEPRSSSSYHPPPPQRYPYPPQNVLMPPGALPPRASGGSPPGWQPHDYPSSSMNSMHMPMPQVPPRGGHQDYGRQAAPWTALPSTSSGGGASPWPPMPFMPASSSSDPTGYDPLAASQVSTSSASSASRPPPVPSYLAGLDPSSSNSRSHYDHSVANRYPYGMQR